MKPNLKKAFAAIRHPRRAIALNVLKTARQKTIREIQSARSDFTMSKIAKQNAKGFEALRTSGHWNSGLEREIAEHAKESWDSGMIAERHLENARKIGNSARQKADWIAGKTKNRKKKA